MANISTVLLWANSCELLDSVKSKAMSVLKGVSEVAAVQPSPLGQFIILTLKEKATKLGPE